MPKRKRPVEEFWQAAVDYQNLYDEALPPAARCEYLLARARQRRAMETVDRAATQRVAAAAALAAASGGGGGGGGAASSGAGAGAASSGGGGGAAAAAASRTTGEEALLCKHARWVGDYERKALLEDQTIAKSHAAELGRKGVAVHLELVKQAVLQSAFPTQINCTGLWHSAKMVQVESCHAPEKMFILHRMQRI
jgi:hypothetical protein